MDLGHRWVAQHARFRARRHARGMHADPHVHVVVVGRRSRREAAISAHLLVAARMILTTDDAHPLLQHAVWATGRVAERRDAASEGLSGSSREDNGTALHKREGRSA